MNGKNLDMDQQEKLLRHAGFCRKGDSIQFSANLEEIREYQEEKYALLEAQLKSSEFEVGFLAEKDYDELEKLWKESFEIYRVPGLKNEWTEIVKDRRIMIIQDVRKRKMVASFFRTFENKSVHISKVCVHKEYQGKSLGKWILLAGLMDAVRSGAKRCITEIDEGNNPSIHAHRFAIPNMQRTGIVAQQFICESEESL